METSPAGLDRAACYRALAARDARFDGRFYVGVRTTGIFCRPICPARTPKLENCRFFPSAASAHAAGFRPCLRCRPEIAPGLAGWRGTGGTVTRALQLIAEGGLDGPGACVESLADRLGVGARHLRRLFDRHVGASPLAVAQTRRLLFAKSLVVETAMPMTEIALASGFGSVRRFNAAMRGTFGRPPGALRRSGREAEPASAGITLRLAHTLPYDWPAMLRFLAARAIPGVERVADGAYARTIAMGGAVGTVEVRAAPAGRSRAAPHLLARIRFPEIAALPVIVARLRRLFDLDADAEAIAAALGADPLLAPLVAARPGLRVPGGWDGFELAVRAILGQQVSVAAASTLAGRLAARFGTPIPDEAGGGEGLTTAFPSPAALAGADIAAIGLPRARAAALAGLAAAAAADPALFSPYGAPEAAAVRLRALPGIGEWTAQYVAMRVLREPDAFPASDLGLLRAVASLTGAAVRPSPGELLARAEAWRPWRAYAALHLWAADAAQAPPVRRAGRRAA